MCWLPRSTWVEPSRDPFNSPLRVTLSSPPRYGWALSLGQKWHNFPKAILLLRGQLGSTPTLVPEPVIANVGCTSCSEQRTVHGGDTANPWDPPPFSLRSSRYSLQWWPELSIWTWCCRGRVLGTRLVLRGSNEAQREWKETGLGEISGSLEQWSPFITVHLSFTKINKYINTYIHTYKKYLRT